MTPGTAVQFVGVCKRFDAAAPAALDHLTLDVGEGEFLFLLGPSGSGKTTALRLIGGYDRPDAGTIVLGGIVANDVPAHCRNVGMVFQSYALFPHMTVAQNVAFGLRMRRVPRPAQAQRIAWALSLVKLDGLAGRYPSELSGGQQQRVALARAIAFGPSLLLLDEPLANLDRHLRDEMRLELKALQRRLGLTTVFVTHDQEEALAMADRIAVLDRGRLEQAGTPFSLYHRPRTTFVAGFMGEMNLLPGTLEGPVRASAADPSAAAGLRLANVAGVPIPVRPPDATGRGDAILVCLRAERLRLRAAGQNPAEGQGKSRWDGRVQLVTFLGAVTLYLVKLETGPTVRVIEPNTGEMPPWQPDDPVEVVWPGEAAFCLQESRAA